MRKIYLCVVILFVCSGVQAQYKKASFLNKSGRTYDLGGIANFLSGGAGTFPGIYYSYGRDQGKRTFHWFDLEVVLPTKFSYTSVDRSNTSIPVTVYCKSKPIFIYRYNFAYYLNNPETSESKLKPFVTAGLNFMVTSSDAVDYDIKPSNTSPVKVVDFGSRSFGANLGIGGIYEITENFGIKLMAGYNVQFQKKSGQYVAGDGYVLYNVYSSHPYLGLGIRFLIKGDGE